MANSKVGCLLVGPIPKRGTIMLISIYPQFHQQSPHVTIKPQGTGVKNRWSMISKGYLNLGFVTLSEKSKIDDEYTYIYYENILLAAPRFHLLTRYANPPG